MATTGTLRTVALPMVITARNGSTTASLSELAGGTTDRRSTAMWIVTMIRATAITAGTRPVANISTTTTTSMTSTAGIQRTTRGITATTTTTTTDTNFRYKSPA